MKIDDIIMGFHKLDVKIGDRLVGTLAMNKHNMIAFAYDDKWIETGFSISPFSLPLKTGVFTPTKPYFNGLFGVFADSLPDAWGQLLLDRYLKKIGVPLDAVNTLTRLALVGETGMGALIYHPSAQLPDERFIEDFDVLAKECRKLLKNEGECDHLDELYRAGGSSGGTRPKINIDIDGRTWLVKFPSHIDTTDIGAMEYDYARCAYRCGIRMPETRLFESKESKGYFGSVRFDRRDGKRIHMVSAAGLLELDFEQPSLDYTELMKLVKIMTRDSNKDILQMYRLMCFNVYAHNQDDHTKNFSFLYDEEKNIWELAPAYDLTYSTTYYREHTTGVAGNGRNPGETDILKVAEAAGLPSDEARQISENIKNQVMADLGKYLS